MAFIGIFLVMMLGVIIAVYIRFITQYAIWLMGLSIICTVGLVLIYMGYVNRQSSAERVRAAGKPMLIAGLSLFLLSIAVTGGMFIHFVLTK